MQLRLPTSALVCLLLASLSGCESDPCTCPYPDGGLPTDAGPLEDAAAMPDGGACVPDNLEPSSAAMPAAIVVGMGYNGLTLCSEQDVYSFSGTGNPMTICLAFTHAEGDIDVLVSTDSLAEQIIGGARSRTDDERAPLLGTAAGVPYYVTVYTDEPVDTSYDLAVFDGNVTCP